MVQGREKIKMTIEIRGSKIDYGINFEGFRVIDTKMSQRIGGARVSRNFITGKYSVFRHNLTEIVAEDLSYHHAMELAKGIAILDAKKYSDKTHMKIKDLTAKVK